jgi:hypothetical protein
MLKNHSGIIDEAIMDMGKSLRLPLRKTAILPTASPLFFHLSKN